MDRSGRRGAFFTLLGLLALGAPGALVLVGLMLVHAVVPFPSELVNAAAGFVYGVWIAFPLVLFGWLLSALATYAIGRTAARPALQRFVGEERLEEGARLVERGGITALLAARLVPIVPYSAVGYVAGAARVPIWRFAWTTLVGSAPLCAAVVYRGNRLDSLSPTDPGLLVAVGAFVLLLVGGRALTQRVRRREPA